MRSLADRVWLGVALLIVAALPLIAAEHSPTLDNRIAITARNEPISVILFLDNRLTMDDVYPVARTLPMSERRTYVAKTLQKRFDEMSPRVMERLEQAQKDGSVTLLRPLWILNAIRVSATAEVLADVDKNFSEVIYMLNDAVYDNVLDTSWSVIDIGADRVWSQLGVDGSGVIVGHKDSGLDYTHPGFDGHIWINPGEDLNHNGHIDAGEDNGIDDDGNGYVDDFRGWNFDDNTNDVSDGEGHGTRTASVISSNPTPCDYVSVAPGAKLMELRGYLTQGAGWEASQYAIANGANVLSASFSFKQNDCGTYRDCPSYVAHRWVSEMELAAGIIHANSTGNDGLLNPVPLSIPAPADSPPPAMTAGHEQQGGLSSIVAVAGYFQGHTYYTGSGHGPSAWSHQDICVDPRMPFCGPGQYPATFEDYPYQGGQFPGLAKPDVTAPTVVPSLAVGGGCSSINGTSGATPHVGGVLALIYSAFPGITPEDAYLTLIAGVQDSGAVGYDSLWGFGMIRALQSCSTGVAMRAVISGVVTDGQGALGNATVSTDDAQPVTTDGTGHYEISVSAGLHTIHYHKYGHVDTSSDVTVAEGQTVTHNVTMQNAAPATLTATVTGLSAPLANMSVEIPDIPFAGMTNAQGQFVLNAYAGSYQATIGSLPWETRGFGFTLAPGDNSIQFNLDRSERAIATFGDSYGYYMYDIYDADAVQYDWVEINPAQGGQGTNLNVTADNSVVQGLPFTAQFYGQNYTSITIAANGNIVFGSTTSNEWAPYPIPRAEAPNGFLAPFFTDWVPQNGGGVYYYNDAANHRVIVEWWNVPDFFNIITATFEVILYEPGFPATPTNDSEIKYQYSLVDGRFEGIVGIESPDGQQGLQYEFQTFYEVHASPIVAERAVLITTNPTLKADNPVATLPREFSLEPNYPNPFNPSTTFVWNVPRRSHLTLALYDVLGRQSAVVFDGVSEAGRHELTFDASVLPTGMYFARLEQGEKSLAVRKVLLLK